MANLTCCQGSYSSMRRKADVATTLFTVDIFTERDPTFTKTSRKIHWLLCFLFAFEKRRTIAFQVIKALNKQAFFAKPGKVHQNPIFIKLTTRHTTRARGLECGHSDSQNR